MKNSKTIALVIGVLGLFLSLPLFFVSEDSEGFFGSANFSMVTIGIAFVIFALLVTLAIFLYYKVQDVMKHQAHKKEMGLLLMLVAGSLVIGFILALITGGSDPVSKGTGGFYDSKALLLSITTGIWATAILILGAVGFWIKSAITTSNN